MTIALSAIGTFGQKQSHDPETVFPAVPDKSRSIDTLATKLLEQKDAMGYIFVYAGSASPAGETDKNIKLIRKYLVMQRGIDTNRLVIADGGFRETSQVQSVLVLPGTEPPKPSPSVVARPVQASAVKVDEFDVGNAESEMLRLDAFTNELQNRTDADGYIIVYSGQKGRSGEAKMIAKRMLKYLVKQRRVDSTRIKTIDGGKKEKATVELWAVPHGAAPPEPV